MDQRPAGSSIAIHERVDGLELSVSDGCVGDRWQRVVVAERAQIGDEFLHELGRRGHESGGTGVVGAPPDPVLLLAEAPVAFEPRPARSRE